MMFISDQELARSTEILTGRLFFETKGWSRLFGFDEYRQWILSAVGEAIAIGLAQHETFDPTKSDLIHWFYLKARKIAQRDLKQEQRHHDLVAILEKECPLQDFHSDPFAHFLLNDELFEVLTQLSEDQYQAVMLVYFVGMSPREAGCMMKRERNAVDALIHRAKEKARKLYRQRMLPPPLPETGSPSPGGDLPKPRSSLSSEDDEDPMTAVRNRGVFNVEESER